MESLYCLLCSLTCVLHIVSQAILSTYLNAICGCLVLSEQRLLYLESVTTLSDTNYQETSQFAEKYLEWPTNEDVKYIYSLVIMQGLKPSPVSIHTCIAKLKATVGQRIATFRGETNQTWHVLTALIYNDLSSLLKERSLAQRRSEGPRARNTSEWGALFLSSHTCMPSPLWLGTQLLRLPVPQMRKTTHSQP